LNPPPLEFNLVVHLGDDASADELDVAARQLRFELEEAGVAEVDLAPGGQLPEGAKSAEAVRIGALTLTLLPAAFAAVLAVIRDWAGRRPGRTLLFEYDTGQQRVRLEYDPDKTDVNQLLAQLAQGQGARLNVGGDMVSGDKTTHNEAGGDVVGRDKLTTINVAPGSTLIVSDTALGTFKTAPGPGPTAPD